MGQTTSDRAGRMTAIGFITAPTEQVGIKSGKSAWPASRRFKSQKTEAASRQSYRLTVRPSITRTKEVSGRFRRLAEARPGFWHRSVILVLISRPQGTAYISLTGAPRKGRFGSWT